jgi:hypothetical protein
VRTLAQLDDVSPQTWTVEEQLFHLTDTFADVSRQHSDIMEPYAILLGDAATDAERMSIMRRGLRETIGFRHQMGKARSLGRQADKLAAEQNA